MCFYQSQFPQPWCCCIKGRLRQEQEERREKSVEHNVRCSTEGLLRIRVGKALEARRRQPESRVSGGKSKGEEGVRSDLKRVASGERISDLFAMFGCLVCLISLACLTPIFRHRPSFPVKLMAHGNAL